jgi:branched-chain amino acid:cation transporter, LIVCS family
MPHTKPKYIQPKTSTLATGLAMFSMFFGAGNVVFPLSLGQLAEDHSIYATLGLLITAVGVPFLGLIAAALFAGNYENFFERIGKGPGFILIGIILALIGPFGAIPRCIALSYSTISLFIPNLSLPLFSIASCVLIFLLTFKKNNILDILGYYLTPVLLISLGVIIIKGLWTAPATPLHTEHSPTEIFLMGLKEGYQTMDLLATFFFSSVVLACLKKDVVSGENQNYRQLIKVMLQASAIGAFLLASIYVGFSFVAAAHSESLSHISPDLLPGYIALQILGPFGGTIVCIAVALACLTTAIALAAVFADFIKKDLSQNKLGYVPSLIITLLITYFISTLEFNGIVKLLAPILQICYPALILLTVLNIAYKLFHFKPVKVPVLVVFIASLIGYLL